MKKKLIKIEYKPKKSPKWELAINAILNSRIDVSFYPKEGEAFISLKDDDYWSIVIKKDGTWDLQ